MHFMFFSAFEAVNILVSTKELEKRHLIYSGIRETEGGNKNLTCPVVDDISI